MPAEGNRGFFWHISSEQNSKMSLEQSQQDEQDAITLWGKVWDYLAFMSTRGICTSVAMPPPIASLGLYVVLHGTDRIHPTEQVTTWAICAWCLFGWGCFAIEQLKYNQNSLMLIVQVINEHQWGFQISTREASQSTFLNVINVQWCQNNYYFSVLVPGSQVSFTVSLIKKRSDYFLSLFLVLQRLVSEPPGKV